MGFELKISLFWLIVRCLVQLLQRNPDSLASRIAFSWHGPSPQVGERRSAFYVRQISYAVGWLVQLLVVAALLCIGAWLIPAVQSAESFLIICTFALTIGIGMAILASISCALIAAKARYVGPDPEFTLAIPLDQEGDDEDSES